MRGGRRPWEKSRGGHGMGSVVCTKEIRDALGFGNFVSKLELD